MQKVYFKTFGCRTNIFDTQIMADAFGAHQITQNEAEADVIIINSCTVTNGADSGVRNYANKTRANRPNVRLMFTGCGADSLGKKLLEEGKIDALFGSSEKLNAPQFALSESQIYKLGVKDFIDETVVSEFIGKTRAYIKIQEGCDFACSYCIIPSVRGKSRSLKEETILAQVELLASDGYSEFTLTGTNVGSYKDLAKLIAKIGALKNVWRIRLGSVEPCQVSDELLEVMSEDFFAKHIHVALQHTHNDILKAMNRKNFFEGDAKLLQKLSDIGFAIGTDFIVGFIGESDDIWSEAIKRVGDLPLTHVHPFIFSPRDATPAAKLKGAPRGDVSKIRLKELNDLVANKNYNFRKNVAKLQVLQVLVEENGGGFDQFYNRCDVGGVSSKTWVNVSNVEVLPDKNIAMEFEICKK